MNFAYLNEANRKVFEDDLHRSQGKDPHFEPYRGPRKIKNDSKTKNSSVTNL